MLDVVFSVLLILLFGVPAIIFFDKLLEDCKKFLVYRRKADNIYKVNNSFPYCFAYSTGSMTFQSDLLIFCPSTVKYHPVKIVVGRKILSLSL